MITERADLGDRPPDQRRAPRPSGSRAVPRTSSIGASGDEVLHRRDGREGAAPARRPRSSRSRPRSRRATGGAGPDRDPRVDDDPAVDDDDRRDGDDRDHEVRARARA